MTPADRPERDCREPAASEPEALTSEELDDLAPPSDSCRGCGHPHFTGLDGEEGKGYWHCAISGSRVESDEFHVPRVSGGCPLRRLVAQARRRLDAESRCCDVGFRRWHEMCKYRRFLRRRHKCW
jgi:hypothetical protein